MIFKKAERRSSKARIAICGPSGSGKSYSALLIAKGLGGKVAAIDTENGSLSLYSNLHEFDVLELEAPYTPERYIQAIQEAEKAGYDSIIIDSITHEWIGKGGVLEIHDVMPGNSWANWSKVTPRHQKFIEAMIQSKCHIIATMRTKTEYIENDKNGKKTIEKAGAAPQQRDGMDYEFTLCLDVQQSNHIASASKDRTTLWDGRFEKITEAHGAELKKWLGSEDEKPEAKPPAEKQTPQEAPPKHPEGKTSTEQPEAPPSPPNAKSEQSAGDVAAEIARIRKLAHDCGLKTAEEFAGVVSGFVGRQVSKTTDLNASERIKAIEGLEAMKGVVSNG